MKKTIDLSDKRIIISRTDSIGDVMLTLPICHWIKTHFSNTTVIFLGRSYTVPILQSYTQIDEIVDWDSFSGIPTVEKTSKFRELNADVIIHVFPNKDIASLAKKVKVPVRVGTSHRSFHLLTCSIRLNFSRKNSNFHEAQLNHELLKPFGLTELPSLENLNETTASFQPKKMELPAELEHFLTIHQTCYVLHPKSQGSAVEWPMQKYLALAKKLADNNIGVIFTGTTSEGEIFSNDVTAVFDLHPYVFNSAGMLSLNQLMELISRATGIVACSTGPLHIGGFLGVETIGLFSSKRPIHPGRWKPLGPKVEILTSASTNPKQSPTIDIQNITVEQVLEALEID